MRFDKTRIIFPIIFSLALLVAPYELAKAEDSLWTVDRAKLKELSGENCQEAWSILWPWAKKANLEARLKLLGFVQWGYLTTPGHSDTASRVRDMTILTIHSSGYNGNFAHVGPEDPRLTTFSSADFPIIYADFLECYRNGDSRACADDAVKDNLVPSFEDYAKEIDGLLSLGHQVKCLDHENQKQLEVKRGTK